MGKLFHTFTHVAPRRQVAAADLRARLPQVDQALLLLSLVHTTGDLSLLERFGPELKRPEVTHTKELMGRAPKATMPPHLLDELVEIAVTALDRDPGEQAPYVTGYELPDEAFQQMAGLSVGTDFDIDYTRMFKEQAGFVTEHERHDAPSGSPERIEVAIIGSGMTGIASAIHAMDRGFSVQIFERTEDLGGTWSINKYPGVAVDTPAMYYSYAFEMNHRWSNYVPSGAEYHDYLSDVADKYGVREHIRFGHEVLGARWDDDAQEWELTVVEGGRDRRTVRATALVTALGALGRPQYPDILGVESFAGETMHANRWDPGVELAGKRIGIIGTSSTSVQIVPRVAPDAQRLTVFQRQPAWVMPNTLGDGVVPEAERWAREHLPYYLHWNRFKDYYPHSDHTGYPLVRVDEEWATQHASTSPANDHVMNIFLGYIHACFGEGSELARKVTPRFPPLAKRIVKESGDFAPGGFYHALTLPQVDLEAEEIARVLPDGVLTGDGRFIELDVIIYATGMRMEWLAPLDIVGRGGTRLRELWKGANPRAYMCGLVPGFPNLFVHNGPNSGAGHGGGHNLMMDLENHFQLECLQLLVDHDARSIEVTREAYETWNAELDERMAGSIWSWDHGANTYYKNSAGRPIVPNPFRHLEMWNRTRTPDPAHFTLR